MAENHKHPKFEDLPLDPSGPVGNAWGLFGPSDELGMLNLLTPKTVTAAVQEIKEGTRISLDWPLNKPSTPNFNRAVFQQKILPKAPRLVNDDELTFNTQSSSQWDGFRHFGYQDARRFFNNRKQDEIESSSVMGIDVWVDNGGIVGRGILLDYAAWIAKKSISMNPLEPVGIPLEHLKQIVQEKDIQIRSGDILFIRSGFTAAYNNLSTDQQNSLSERPNPSAFIGVEPTIEVLRWLWENQFAAVAGDTVAFEQAPLKGPHSSMDGTLHQWLLAGWGMPIGELFDLEKLAEHCERIGRWSFFLTSVPLKVPGGIASPPNAVAIF